MSDCGELEEDDKNIMAQNQVALIAVCELAQPPKSPTDSDTAGLKSSYSLFWANQVSNICLGYNLDSSTAPPIIIGTTHLKSSKSPTGERYRQKVSWGFFNGNDVFVLNDSDRECCRF